MTAFFQSDCGCDCTGLAQPCDDCTPPCTPPAPVVTGGTVTGRVGVPFEYYIVATNSPTSHSATLLPPGIELFGGGLLSGTPTLSGSYLVTIGASNACGSGYAELEITIEDPVPCSEPPTLLCDSIAASKSKCGYLEYAGHESTPPKYYLYKGWNGDVREEVFNGPECAGTPDEVNVHTYFGSCTYDRLTCAATGAFSYTHHRDGVLVTSAAPDCTASLGNYIDFCSDLECPPSYSATMVQFVPDVVCRGTFPASRYLSVGSAPFEQLTDEYTTAQLIADAVAALPAYPGTWGGDCAAIRDLSTDEATYSLQRFKYKFALPDMTGRLAATLSWVERFTPAGGGSPVDTPRSWVWDGVATHSPEYTVGEPAANGMIEIAEVELECL